MRNRIPWKEWLLLLGSLILAFGGSLMLLEPRNPNDRLIGTAITLMFFVSALLFAGTLWRRRRDKTYRSVRTVTIAPGVPLRMRKGRILLLGAVTGGLGNLVMAAAWVDKAYIVVGAGAIFALGGSVLLLVLALRLVGSQYLLFEKEGLRVGDAKGSFLAAWDNLAWVQTGEVNHNAAVFVGFKDPVSAAATARGKGKKWSAQMILKEFNGAQAWQGCDWMVLSWQYGVEAPILAKALATYATDPAVRKGLEKRLELPGNAGQEGRMSPAPPKVGRADRHSPRERS